MVKVLVALVQRTGLVAVVAVELAVLVLVVTEALLVFTALAGVEKLKVRVGTQLELPLRLLRLVA
jgi:hypothetical protein